MFSDSCRNFHQLSKFAIKNLVKGRKVKFMAFYWPFWPLKVKFWNIMQLTRSCQAFSFGFVSLNDLILKIIFGSPITRRDYVVLWSMMCIDPIYLDLDTIRYPYQIMDLDTIQIQKYPDGSSSDTIQIRSKVLIVH